MSFAALLDDVASQRKHVVVYAPDETRTDLAEQLQTRNLAVDHRTFPGTAADAFVIVRDDGEFRGAIALADLLTFLEPPVRRPDELNTLDPGYRAVYELLDDTVFVALNRRQLLATSREFEDRAWRTGRGRLHAGFQSATALEAQADLYRDLAATTDVDVHVYAADTISTEAFDGTAVTTHTEPAAEVGRFWFLLFEDGGDGRQNCALVAEQLDDKYRGVWTYDTSLVARAFEALE